MGYEVFLVELHGGKGSYEQANEAVRRLSHVKPDPDGGFMPGAAYYVFRDSEHTIEMELMAAPVRLACRFTLCHPASVDAIFLRLLHELMTRLEMDVTIRDDVRPEHAHAFSINAFAEFSAIVLGYIAARRTEWLAAFGEEARGLSTNEVYQRIILPRCQPRTELASRCRTESGPHS